MKRFLLHIFFILIPLIGVSQQYKGHYLIDIDYSVQYTSNNTNCSSNLQIALTFKKKGRVLLNYRALQGMSKNAIWTGNGKYLFPSDDELLSIEVYGTRYTSNMFGCQHRDGNYWLIHKAGEHFTYPCTNKKIYGVPGYNGESFIVIKINPTSNNQLFNINIIHSASTKNTNTSLKTSKINYKVDVIYDDNNEENIINKSETLTWYKAHVNVVGSISPLKKIKKIRITNGATILKKINSFTYNEVYEEIIDEIYPPTSSNWGKLLSKKELSTLYKVKEKYPPSTKYNTATLTYTYDISYNGSALVPIEYSPGTSMYLPSHDTITLTAKSGFPENLHRWQYRIPGYQNLWTNLPSKYQGSSTLSIAGKDIFGNNTAYINKVIEFRGIYSCNTYDATQNSVIALDYRKSAPHIVDWEISNLKCKGGSDGRIKLKFNRALEAGEILSFGINGNLESSLANVSSFDENNTYTISNLEEKIYSIFFIGKYNGEMMYSEGKRHSIKDTVKSPLPLQFNLTNTLNVNCHDGEDGQIHISASGGTTPYKATYSRNGGSEVITSGFSDTQAINSLISGNYQIRLTDTFGCIPNVSNTEKILTANIQQPAAPVQFGLADTLSPSGYKLTNGYIEFNPTTGGSGGYTYEWTKNGTLFTPSPSGTNAQNLGTGLYHITVRDSKYSLAYPVNETNCRGCYDTISFFLSQPDSLEIRISIEDSIKCYNGSGKLTTSTIGGVKPYVNYKWEKWDGGLWRVQPSSNASLENAYTGKYRVTVSDRENNQSQSPEFTIAQPDSLMITGFNTLDPSCYAYSNGWAEPVVTGGSAPYSYRWLEAVANPDTIRLTGLAKGSYDVKVTDRNGCEVYGTTTLDQPDTLTITEAITLPSAYNTSDGSIQLSVSGGTPSYTYLWDYNNSTANPLINIPANDNPYEVTVSDSHGCSKKAYPRVIYPIGVDIFVKDSILCSGNTNGSLRAWVFGGVGTNYRYEWFEVVNSIPQSLNVYDSILSNIGAGTYQVNATDIENNSVMSAEFVFNSPDSLKVSLTQYNLLCKYDTDGWIEAHPTGGTAPFSYQWSNNNTSKKISGLEEGNYSVIMTDNRGCFVNESTAITAPNELMLQIHYIDPQAHNYSDASVWVSVTGGTTPYSYAWQNRTETVDSIGGIPHGIYTAIVTDVNGCSKQISVTIPNPPLLEAFAAESRVISCNGESDGQLTATSLGGVGSHSYTWYKRESGTLHQLSTGNVLNNIPAGIYVVKVTDGNSIDAYSADFSLVHPDILQVSVNSNSIACNGDTDGWVKATVIGGTAPYSYQWTSGHNTDEATGLVDDKYFVFVTDLRGCQTKGQGEVSVPGGLTIDTLVIMPTCYNGTDGSISIEVSGGVSPYSYNWSNGAAGTSIGNLPSGDYWVRVTGANGCFKVINVRLGNPDPVIIELGANRTLCLDQQIELDATINDPMAQYQWQRNYSTIASTAKILLGEAGTYSVTASDSKGCKGQSSIQIQKNDSEVVANFAVSHIVARGAVTQLANANYPSPEKIEWLIPDDPNISIVRINDEYADVIFLQNGTYMVGMRSTQGECEQVLYKPVEVLDRHEIPDDKVEPEVFLKQFIVFPNPSNGQFTVRIELGEAADIRLRLLNLSGNLIDERTVSGNDNYEIYYDVIGRQGVHILQLISSKANTSVKLIFGQ